MVQCAKHKNKLISSVKGAAIQSVKPFNCGASNIAKHQVSVQFIYFQVGSCPKKNGKMNFSKKSHFLKNLSKFKARYKKSKIRYKFYAVYCTSGYETL